MTPLSRWLYAYITVVVCVAVAAAFMTLDAFAKPLDARQAWIAPVLLVFFSVAAQFSLRLAPKHQQELSPAPGLAAAVLLPPPIAIAICAAGQLVGELRQTHGRPAQSMFNTAVVSLQAGAAATAATFAEALTVDDGSYSGLFVVGLAAISWFSVGALLTEGAVAIQTNQRPGLRWWERQRVATRVEGSLLVIGACAALMVDVRPWVLPLLIAPVAEIYRALTTQQLSLRAAYAGRERAEQARRHLAALVDSTPDFVLTLDAASNITYANPAARALLGLSDLFELKTLPVDRIFPGWKCATTAAAAAGSWSGDSELATPDGPIPVSQVVVVHRSPRGEVEFISTSARDVREQKSVEQQLRYLADHDALTGVFNRRRFEDEVERRLDRERRSRGGGALMYVDLDGFKDVNDRYGHWAGDRLLQQIATGLRGVVENADGTVGRLGGDEFGIVVSGVDRRGAATVAARVLHTIRRCTVDVAGREVSLTGSVGVALYGSSRILRDDLMAMADGAMYEAKRTGNGFRFAIPPGSRQLTA